MDLNQARLQAAKNYEEIGHTPISYTSLKKLRAGGINQFYRYKERELEQEESRSLDFGTLVDNYLLRHDTFDEKFILNDTETPSSENQQLFAAQVAEGMSIEDAYRNNYKSAPKTASKLTEKAQVLYNSLKDYIEFLPKMQGKETYSMDDSYALNQVRMNISGHKVASKLFPWITMSDSLDYIEIGTCVEYEVEFEGFKFKGELDMIVINHNTKTVTVYDLKTTRAFLSNFKWEANSYGYFLQLYLYNLIATYGILPELHTQYGEHYKISNRPKFIVVRNTGDYGVDVQEPDPKQILGEADKLEKDLNILEWHYANKKFKYSKEYYEGNGIIKMEYVEDLTEWRENVTQQLSID